MKDDVNKRVQELEAFRKRAQLAYIYLGLLLLGAIAVTFLVSRPLGLGLLALAAALYLGFFKREIGAYREGMLRERVLASFGGGEVSLHYAAKGGTDLSSFAADGAVPMNNANGMARHLFTGERGGLNVTLCDLSFVYEGQEHGRQRQAYPVSGCYIRLQLAQSAPFSVACCAKRLLPEGLVEAYYEGQGLQCVGSRERDYLTFARSPQEKIPEAVQKELMVLLRKNDGMMALRVEGTRLCALLPHRYLGRFEPDYKHPVTAAQLNACALWELEPLLHLAQLCAQADGE